MRDSYWKGPCRLAGIFFWRALAGQAVRGARHLAAILHAVRTTKMF